MDFQPLLEKVCGEFQANATTSSSSTRRDTSSFGQFKGFLDQVGFLLKTVKEDLFKVMMDSSNPGKYSKDNPSGKR